MSNAEFGPEIDSQTRREFDEIVEQMQTADQQAAVTRFLNGLGTISGELSVSGETADAPDPELE